MPEGTRRAEDPMKDGWIVYRKISDSLVYED
jgi:hypothetical protein